MKDSLAYIHNPLRIFFLFLTSLILIILISFLPPFLTPLFLKSPSTPLPSLAGSSIPRHLSFPCLFPSTPKDSLNFLTGLASSHFERGEI